MIKQILLGALLTLTALPSQAKEVCDVQVCNKLERFTLDPFSMLKDSLGEMCMDATIDSKDAIAGKELSSESRWYQGSNFNPTKRSVTRVKKVYECYEVKTLKN